MFKINIMIKSLIITAIVSCSTTVNWLSYTDTTNNFKIKYSDKWAKQNINGVVAFLSPKENDKDNFQENVNIMVQDLSKQPLTLEEYTEITKKQITDNLGASAIVSLKDVTVSGQKAKELVYNMDYSGRKLKMKQYWFIKSNKAYVLTYTAEPSQFDKYESISTETIQSFSLF